MGVSNAVVFVLAAILIGVVYPDCRGDDKEMLPFGAVLVGSCMRILVMIRTGIVQQSTATMILKSPTQSAVFDAVIRRERRVGTRFLRIARILRSYDKRAELLESLSSCLFIKSSFKMGLLQKQIKFEHFF